MTTHKTNELTGDLLNRAVAKALGWKIKYCSRFEHDVYFSNNAEMIMSVHNYNPVENWQQCGQLIERFKIDIFWTDYAKNVECNIYENENLKCTAVTDAIDIKTAICRCVVQSVFGDEVEL